MDSLPIRTIGICGGGKMGNSFFDHLSQYGFDIIFYQRNHQKACSGRKKWERRIERVKQASPDTQSPGSVVFTSELNTLARADLIVEMITEDLRSKQAMINALAAVNKKAVIATGSSAFVPDRLTTSKSVLQRLVGLHYFYPIPFTEYVEVIINQLFLAEYLNRIKSFLGNIDKKALVFSGDTGSVLNKLILYYQNEALLMAFTENVSPAVIDEVVEDSLFTLGPFRYMDMVGIDTMYHSRLEYIQGDPFYSSFIITQSKLKEMVAHGYLGKKNKKGFYTYPAGLLSTQFDNADNMVDRNLIAERLQTVFINTGLRFLELNYLSREQLRTISIQLLQAHLGPLEILSKIGFDYYYNSTTKLYSQWDRYYKPVQLLKENITDKKEEESHGTIRKFSLENSRENRAFNY